MYPKSKNFKRRSCQASLLHQVKKMRLENIDHLQLKSARDVADFISSEYNCTVKFCQSRSRMRNIDRTTAKISRYHILESRYQGQDICYKILSTNIKLEARYENINLNAIIPTLSPILDSFKNRHNRYDYLNSLKSLIEKEKSNGKYRKQKYKNQIHVHLLQYFYSLLLYRDKIVPPKLFGTTQNLKIVKKMIHSLLNTAPERLQIQKSFKRIIKRQSMINPLGVSFDMRPFLEKFNVCVFKGERIRVCSRLYHTISKIQWLHPLESDTAKWIVLVKLLRWFFAQYIIKILHKNIMLKPGARNKWIYITKEDWYKMQKEFFEEKENKGDLVTPATLNISRWNLPVGKYKFLPSTSGLRPLLIQKYSNDDKDTIDIVLRFLQQLFVTHCSERRIPTVESCIREIFVYKKALTGKRLYFVRCDIRDAFGSIKQAKLYNIINNILEHKLPRYLVVRTYIRLKDKNTIVQFLDLERSIQHTKIVPKKPKLVQTTKLLKKIYVLIFGHKVNANSKRYLIKRGVPQGVPVSSILSNIYYHDMLNKALSVYKNNGVLSLYIDDIMYVTENKDYAVEFLKIARKGIPDYGVIFNPNKIKTNVGLPYNPRTVKYLGIKIKF